MSKIIFNLPTTVEYTTPNVYADQIEYFCKHISNRENVIVSTHCHNDRGTGVASAELGLLAGADRVEGCIFGNGERTGNLDVVTVALNMFSQGVDPELDFSDIPAIRSVYERLTRMTVPDRAPYGGNLVFTAFSGSHQDAIAKGMKNREEHDCEHWTVPYLPIDPVDIGRTYEADVIRINSQSGKGGVSYILKTSHGVVIPDPMREEIGYMMKGISDRAHAELTPDQIYDEFCKEYANKSDCFAINDCEFKRVSGQEGITAEVSLTVTKDGSTSTVTGVGNGRLDAVSNALKKFFNITYLLETYEEHALSKGSSSQAMAYVGIRTDNGVVWGVGIDPDIIRASINALGSAINRSMVKNYGISRKNA